MAGIRKSEARRWFQQATYDLKASSWNIEGGFYDTTCFLAQQAAEKAAKSLLYYLGFRKKALFTHSVTELLRSAGSNDPIFLTYQEYARELDLHYIPSRYPNGLPSGFPYRFYSRETAERAFAAATCIVETIRDYYSVRNETEILSEEEP
ncbi:MAG: HEPN domain-containing protein [Deltaproteobacteria bacterium]|nr:HEPN domain-containing protein [Deltaproteobacteria bacterium]